MTDALTDTYGAKWRLWRSARGEFYCATRRRDLTRVQLNAGLAPTLIEDNPVALAQALADQAKREGAR